MSPAPEGPALAVVGLGCIGGSIALRARARGLRVAGFDRPESLRLAAELGLVDECLSSFEHAASASMLVIATPLGATCDYLARLAEMEATPGTVIDVASVKAPAARAGARVAAFVPTHPMAGSEQSGPAAASPTLFERRTWAIVPQGTDDARRRARAFVEAMGATPFEIGAEDHDRVVALTSHLPQTLAVALAAAVGPFLDDPNVAALVGPGLASMTRLGASSWDVWREVLSANRLSVAGEIRSLAATLGDLAHALECGDSAVLENAFAAAATAAREVARANGRGTNPVAGALPAEPAPARSARL